MREHFQVLGCDLGLICALDNPYLRKFPKSKGAIHFFWIIVSVVLRALILIYRSIWRRSRMLLVSFLELLFACPSAPCCSPKWSTLTVYIMPTSAASFAVNMHIYASQAARQGRLSRVNGVRRSSVKTFHIWRELLRSGRHQPCQGWFGSVERLRHHVGATYTGPVTFLLSPFNRTTDNIREPIFAHNSSKDVISCKEDPCGNEKCVVVKCGGVLPHRYP